MKIALLCSGLGNVYRGHEIFARDLFGMLSDTLDITLFKGGGAAAPKELVIANIARDADVLRHITAYASPRWQAAAVAQEQLRIEAETFAYAALQPLLEGGYDIIHCLEREVCELMYGFRHLFRVPPKVVFSNGGAIPAAQLPPCDFVQEHSPYNLGFSARGKAFMLPHGVDLEAFRPGLQSDFRQRHGIPADAFVVISVGTICYWHKRMDYVIREVAAVPHAHLVVVGQNSADTEAIKALGAQLMPGRIVFTRMAHEELPQAYAAADVFTLGSLFETFGIVYIEAMAMGLPVISTAHPNQRAIIQQGVFIDMAAPGALAGALRGRTPQQWRELGLRGRAVAQREYGLDALKQRYLDQYRAIAAAPAVLPRFGARARLGMHARNAYRRARGWLAART